MAAAPVPLFVSVDEYLHADYQPDMDYVDGTLEERNLGEYDHADLQSELITLFRNHRNDWHVKAVVEQRVQISPARFRVPDLCVLRAGQPRKPIITEAPLLCIEVLSPEDRFARIKTRCEDYFHMGVLEAWIFDPANRDVTILRANGPMQTLKEGTLTLGGTAIAVPLAEVFAVLDEQ